MPIATRIAPAYLYVGIAVLMAALFVVDLLTPLGYVVWIFYMAPVVACLLSQDRSAPFVTAAAGSVLLALGYLLSPPGVDPSMSVVNRSIGGATLWALAWVVCMYLGASTAQRRMTWMQEGRVQLSQQMLGELSMAELAGNVLHATADYLDARVGILYTLERGTLLRIGAWALPAGQAGPAEIHLGEGLLGQAVAERRTLTATGLAPDYLKVGSALGTGAPSDVIVVPLKADGQVMGALELGFVNARHSLADRVDLLQTMSESIGSALRSAVYRRKLEELLEETQRQSEELQVQQEELRVSNEELEERSRALMASQAKLETQQAELEQTNQQLAEHTQYLEKQKQGLLAAQQKLAENAVVLERANQYKSEFLANMSHELRTPLNSSLILAKLLADNKEGSLTAEQVRYAKTIHSSNTDLLVLINDILDLSKVEAGHTDINAEPVTIASIAAAMTQSFQPVADQKSLGFRVEAAPDAPDLLITDNQRLQQILRNLLSNAFKFTEKGEVVLRVAAAPPGNVRFDVQDSGIGIAHSQHAAIFEAFRQADGTTSRKYGGSGLGLSISREFAHLLGGDITVSSEPGSGSTFSLTIAIHASPATARREERTPPATSPAALPVAPAMPAPAPVSAPPAGGIDDDRGARARGARLILVIEDDPNFARILYDLAHERDFDCIHASTASEGIALARAEQPCGILLDMGLPDDSGLMVLEQLKRDPVTRHIPIHVVSVADHTETAMFLGAVGYTFKPSERVQLENAIISLESRLNQRVRRILVVEDDPTLRENIQLLLDAPDVELTGCGTVSDALDQLRQTQFDCVVMDLVLPDGSGYDLLEQLANSGRSIYPPVIVYTGRSLTHDEEQRLRRHSKSIIIKGARSPERLLDEVTLFLHSVESELPMAQQRMLKEARQRDSAFEGRRILLAEDDIRNIFALSQVIEPLGAHLVIARNGREALDMLAGEFNIDLVLMDIMMPEMDGLTAMREIRKNGSFKKLPIIALTAKAMPADRQRCLDAGANDYISKPLDVDKLLSLCRVWLPQ